MAEDGLSAEGLEALGEKHLGSGEFQEAARAFRRAAIDYRVRAVIPKYDVDIARRELAKATADLRLRRQWIREHALLKPLPRPDLPVLDNGPAIALLVGITNGTMYERRWRHHARFPEQAKRPPDENGVLLRRLHELLGGLEEVLASRGVAVSSPGGSIVRRAGTLLHAMTQPMQRLSERDEFPWDAIQDPEVRVFMDPIADIAAEFGRRVQESPVPEEDP